VAYIGSSARMLHYNTYEAIRSSETVSFQPTIWRYIPEDRTLHNYRCENLHAVKYECNNVKFEKFDTWQLYDLKRRLLWIGVLSSILAVKGKEITPRMSGTMWQDSFLSGFNILPWYASHHGLAVSLLLPTASRTLINNFIHTPYSLRRQRLPSCGV
jgi:hypothetical protein